MGFLSWMLGRRKREIREKADYFRHPTKSLVEVLDIIKTPNLVPDTKGVYGWYFNQLPGEIPSNENYVRVGKAVLLYIGIAGKSETSQGTLRKRIADFHIDGTAASSGLRLSLGCLLQKQQGLCPRPYDKKGKDIWFGKSGEEQLRFWLVLCARVVWLTDERPWEIEEAVLSANGAYLPLNTEKNPNNPFADRLRQLKDKARIEARVLQ